VGSEESSTIHVNVTYAGATTSLTVDGLRKNSQYRYQIQASNKFGSSPPSTPVEISMVMALVYLFIA
jgi:hypothetical protein